jgi:hypothetical protein
LIFSGLKLEASPREIRKKVSETGKIDIEAGKNGVETGFGDWGFGVRDLGDFELRIGIT